MHQENNNNVQSTVNEDANKIKTRKDRNIYYDLYFVK